MKANVHWHGECGVSIHLKTKLEMKVRKLPKAEDVADPTEIARV